MATITLSPNEFLQPKRLEGVVNKQLETDLQFINMFNVVPQTETTVSYMEDVTTAGEDYDAGTTGKPLDLGELSQLPEVEISPVTQKHGMLKPFGFQMKVSKRDINRGSVIDDLARATFRGTQVMARRMDDSFIAQLQAVSNDFTEGAGAAVWSADGATVADDIIGFQETMDINGSDAQLTDLFVHKTNFYEAKRYFGDLLIGARGEPNFPGDRDVLDVGLGTRLHRARSASIAEGGYLGMDTRPGYLPVTVHAYRDPKFANAAEFPLINVYKYEEEAYPHRVVLEFVADIFPALKLPNSVFYRASGI
jgi:hypothetical protein